MSESPSSPVKKTKVLADDFALGLHRAVSYPAQAVDDIALREGGDIDATKFKEAFGYEFFNSIAIGARNRVRRHSALARLAGGQTEGQTFSSQRRDELTKSDPKSYLPDQYGLLTAAFEDKTATYEGGLGIDNPSSSPYNREDFSEAFLRRFFYLLEHENAGWAKNDEVVFINSENVLKRLVAFYGWPKECTPETLAVAPGVVAVRGVPASGRRDWQHKIAYVGGTPSRHQVLKLEQIAKGKTEPFKNKHHLTDNETTLAELGGMPGGGPLATLKGMSGANGLKALSSTLVSLVEGLKAGATAKKNSYQKDDLFADDLDLFVKNRGEKTSALVNDALKNLNGLIAGMSSSIDDNNAFIR
ncbi:MAG: hypothetical protein P4M00_13915 [Azospirillaceae bacterium]|nr:hypothetical protein [Azospirillaceae bacterium]